MFVEDYMTPNPHTVAPDASLVSVQELMQRHHIHHVPVLDGANRLVGILSDRDVRSAVGYDRTLTEKLSASEVMTAEPTTIALDAQLEEVLQIFRTHRFGAVLVLRSGGLVGIITKSDIVRAFYQLLGLDLPGRRIEVALPNGAPARRGRSWS